MNTYRKSTLIFFVTLITLLSLFLDAGSVEAKRERRHHKNHDKRPPVVYVLPADLFPVVAPVATPPCEPFTDKECATNLRMHIFD